MYSLLRAAFNTNKSNNTNRFPINGGKFKTINYEWGLLGLYGEHHNHYVWQPNITADWFLSRFVMRAGRFLDIMCIRFNAISVSCKISADSLCLSILIFYILKCIFFTRLFRSLHPSNLSSVIAVNVFFVCCKTGSNITQIRCVPHCWMLDTR